MGIFAPALTGWQQSLIAVTPETVVRWHRGGFRLYWKLISRVRRPVGRRETSVEVQELIFRMVVENPTWGGCGAGAYQKLHLPTISEVSRARTS